MFCFEYDIFCLKLVLYWQVIELTNQTTLDVIQKVSFACLGHTSFFVKLCSFKAILILYLKHSIQKLYWFACFISCWLVNSMLHFNHCRLSMWRPSYCYTPTTPGHPFVYSLLHSKHCRSSIWQQLNIFNGQVLKFYPVSI